METMKTIAIRQSCRAYTREQITEEELQKILEAANAAPVASGKYDEVKLTVIQDKNILTKINDVVSKAFEGSNIFSTYDAPTVILVCGKTAEDSDKSVAYCNAACIVENMMLAAAELGLGSVYIYSIASIIGTKTDLYKELMIPDGFMPLSAISVGNSTEPIIERKLTTTRIVTDYLR